MATQDQKSTSVDQTFTQFIDAGIGLAMLPFSLAQKTFTTTKQETANTLNALQARGEELDAKIRETVSPLSFCNKVMSAFSAKSAKQEKINELSEKVDTLVELVATLAAKQAAEKSSTAAETKAAPRKRSPRATSAKAGTKTTAKTRSTRATTATKKDDE